WPLIVVGLNILNPTIGQYHWYIYVADPPTAPGQAPIETGTMFHAVSLADPQHGIPQGTWRYERRDGWSIAQTKRIAVALAIGQMGNHTITDLHSLLSAIPMTVPQADFTTELAFTCRVWIREAVRTLHARGWINCPDVNPLEAEF
ncbi:hypothetical protein C8Q79DRAFT_872717, partial [Trametes meyenii]